MERNAILIVDDVELNRAILAELFHDSYTIFEASNGSEALSILHEHRQHIVIVLLDIIMPVMDGYEVLQAMNENNWISCLPVVLITSENSDAASLKSYTLGVSDIINKPFHPAVVKRRVANIVDLYRHKAHLENLLSTQISALEEQAFQLGQANDFVIDALNSVVDFREHEQSRHVERIRAITHTLLSGLMLRHPQYNIAPHSIAKIALAATLHDIGKVAIPGDVLAKMPHLTPDEYEVFKTHSIKGAEIINRIKSPHKSRYKRYCYDICRYHHERWDGSGYPDALKGAEIPIWAQVVSLANVYDTLTSAHKHKAPHRHEQATAMILHGECGPFNPDLLDVFQSETASLAAISTQNVHNILPPNSPGILARNVSPKTLGDDTRIKKLVQNLPSLSGYANSDQGNLSERILWLLEREREKNRIVTELSGDIVFSYDAITDEIDFSEKFHDDFDASPRLNNARKALQESAQIHPDDKAPLIAALQSFVPGSPRTVLEARLRTRRNRFEWFEIYAHALWDPDEEKHYVAIIGKLVNIHDRKTEESRLQQEARTDPLTGLHNRKSFEEHTHAALHEYENMAALFFLDIDNFKTINDTYGHPTGDLVLRNVGPALRGVLRESDILGRMGGDEFVVYLRHIASPEAAAHKAAQIADALHQITLGEEKAITVSCSIGIALFPKDGTQYDTLLAHADAALYKAKEQGKNRYAFYQQA